MRPREVPNEVPRGLWASWRPDSVRGRDGEERVRSLTSTTRMRRSNDARVRSQEGRDGAEKVRSRRGKREESRGKREEGREKR